MNCEVPRKGIVPSIGQVWAAGKFIFVLIVPGGNDHYRLFDLETGEYHDTWDGLEAFNWKLYGEAS